MMTYVYYLIFSWIYVTVMHEVAHVIVAKHDGATKVRIYPWPHMHEGKFYFARYMYEGVQYTGRGNMIDHAPLTMNFITTLIGFGITFGSFAAFGGILGLTALTDSLVWMWGFYYGGPHTDGYKFRHGRT